jgi:hypothetical protein
MNKFFIAAASTLALASCSSDDFLGEIQGNEQNGATTTINFGGDTGKITRASSTGKTAADLLENNFVVVGFKGNKTDAANNENYAFDHYNVNFNESSANSTLSNLKGWEYVNQDMTVNGAGKSLAQSGATQQTIKYWDHSCASYDFLAFSMGKKGSAPKEYATPSSVDKANLATAAYTLTGDVNTLSECYISDMKTAVEKENDYGKPVELSFRHLASKVRMALFETIPGYVVSDVKFYADATGTTNSEEGTLFGKFNNSGTLTVYFPTTGIVNKDKKDYNKDKKDYNKAHVKFTATTAAGETATLSSKGFGAVKYGNQDEGTIREGSTYLSQNAAKPSYCGDGYQNVLPSEGAASAITLRIDYKLTSVDGSKETINVKGATATVPAQYTEWKSGYAYTYIFKISQDTNGSTGGTSTGLTAISFDAVVVDDEANGLQETITTVSDNSFTTYGYKDNKVTTNGNEYVNGTDIYATVYVPAAGETAAKTVAPQKLYTVTLESGATQTINEASVANALVKGTNDATAKTWTVTDYAGKKMVVTETADGFATTVTEVPAGPGYTLKVNALKWKGVVTDPATETYYAVEYDNGTKKSYKIVKVVKNN